MRSSLKNLTETVRSLRRHLVTVRCFSSEAASLNNLNHSELHGELKMSREDQISSGILKVVTDLVQKHKLISDKIDVDQKVVDFEHPKDLFSLLPLEISPGGCSDEELERIRRGEESVSRLFVIVVFQ